MCISRVTTDGSHSLADMVMTRNRGENGEGRKSSKKVTVEEEWKALSSWTAYAEEEQKAFGSSRASAEEDKEHRAPGEKRMARGGFVLPLRVLIYQGN